MAKKRDKPKSTIYTVGPPGGDQKEVSGFWGSAGTIAGSTATSTITSTASGLLLSSALLSVTGDVMAAIVSGTFVAGIGIAAGIVGTVQEYKKKHLLGFPEEGKKNDCSLSTGRFFSGDRSPYI